MKKQQTQQQAKIAYRADVNTVVFISAKLNKKQRQERFEDFCIHNKIGAYKDFLERRKSAPQLKAK
jgi:hypothetical protein